MILIVERAGIGEILDLAEHLDADAPMLREVVFGAPAIFEAETVRDRDWRPPGSLNRGLSVISSLPLANSTIGPKPILVGITATRGKSHIRS